MYVYDVDISKQFALVHFWGATLDDRQSLLKALHSFSSQMGASDWHKNSRLVLVFWFNPRGMQRHFYIFESIPWTDLDLNMINME